jgi:hypothetical protein
MGAHSEAQAHRVNEGPPLVQFFDARYVDSSIPARGPWEHPIHLGQFVSAYQDYMIARRRYHGLSMVGHVRDWWIGEQSMAEVRRWVSARMAEGVTQ